MSLTALALSSVTANVFALCVLAAQGVAIDPSVAVKQDPAITAAAYVLVISSVGGTIILIINAWSASKDRREAAAERLAALTLTKQVAASAESTDKKADTIVQATAKIHELTNSTNSNLQKALEVMTEKVAGLDRIIAEMRTAKIDTAAAQALTDQRSSLAAPVPVPGVPPVGSPGKPVEMKIVNPPHDPANVTNVEPKP